jgi:hypothetical protein
LLQAAEPLLEYLPRPHFLQVFFFLAPIAEEYLPAMQEVQFVKPVFNAEYFPDGHSVQFPSPEEPTFDDVPSGHSEMHSVAA